MRLRLFHGDIEPHRRVNCAAHEERPGSVEPQFDALAHGLLSRIEGQSGRVNVDVVGDTVVIHHAYHRAGGNCQMIGAEVSVPLAHDDDVSRDRR